MDWPEPAFRVFIFETKKRSCAFFRESAGFYATKDIQTELLNKNGPGPGPRGGCSAPGCDLDTTRYDLGTSCIATGVRAAAQLGVRTGNELGTSFLRTRNKLFKSAASKPILDWRGQGGESVAGKTKEFLIGGLKKRNAETEQEEQAKTRPSPSPDS